MISVDEELIDCATEAVYNILNGHIPRQIEIPEDLPDNEFRQMLTYINLLIDTFIPFANAMERLAAGHLDEPLRSGRMSAIHSYKALQSNLRHLTWKTQQIAEGDLKQEVDFMGDFSVAFNTMTSQLREAFETIAERNETLRLANVAIGEEREKSERLLLNILPAKVAEELKRSGRSEPQMFEEVTVFFSDVVGFVSLSSKLSPIEIIDELNTLYTRFDEIIDAHGCERIKTIGDAYLAVCGMPRHDDDHARNIVSAAAEIMQNVKKGHHSQRRWKIRVGIHSGPVVGGIVGVKKYIYDVFGDTINIASRMESSSEPMRINVSEATWRLVRDQFTFVDRGIKEVKGIGPTRMFFLDVA